MTTWQSSRTPFVLVLSSDLLSGLRQTKMKPLGPRKYAALMLSVVCIFIILDSIEAMSAEEKRKAKEQVVEMFYHAYNSYMDNAYPADELMPLSCKGRYRGSEPSRGDIDDSLGNFTLTLIDALDTLAVLGDVEGFDEAVQSISRDARFDSDVIVSVFETNIRVLGGLLGGHVMASYFKRQNLGLDWYNDELLAQAKEVGDRLLPAFNTSTGIPFPRINLKHGVVPQITSSYRDTCTACAGSMILEFAALSRLTGIPVYEDKARKAMDYLWQQRHRGSDLMGLVINIHSGDWIRRESGVGAGIDSYYEYVLKAYVLLGDDDYLARFNKHYDAVMRYVSQGPLLIDVHMHKPNAISRNFMDALLAFWPGLQVLKGDLVPAIETHEMLYQVMQRHNFIPEAFTTDFRVHWSHHPLRPEFIESTYFLYKATGDDYYLEAGKEVLDNLEEHARVACGYAAIKNVKTGTHEDQMDSYVLAEMFKYLYLLFAQRSDLLFDIDDFIFTTEAHLLPLALSVGNITAAAAASKLPKIRREVYSKFQVDLNPPTSDNYITTTIDPNLNIKSDASEIQDEDEEDDTGEHVCPNLHATHADGRRYPHSVRSQIQNMVSRLGAPHKSRSPRLRAADFIAGNKEQLEMLHAMGIRIATMADGRIQLLHTASEAQSPEDAENGMQFMQEMIELSKQQQPEAQHEPMFIHVSIPGLSSKLTLRAGPAQFGYNLKEKSPVSGMLAMARPFRVCREIENAYELSGHVVILERGDCMFVDKARNLQRIGAKAGIVLDHTEGSTSDSQPLFAMSGDGVNDVNIPMVFLYHKEGHNLLKLLADNSFLEVQLSASSEDTLEEGKSAEEKQEEVTFDPANPSGSSCSDSLHVKSGETKEFEPPPLSQEQPVEPFTTAGSSDVDEEEEDRFAKFIDDKFYHHEAQLRDLYYLQGGSRFMHINVEVRPSPTRPPPITQRENAFALDVLPDGSKMMTCRLTYQSPGYEQHKPQLNQMYMDIVHLLQLHSNFNDLQHATDYLRALARFLEAAYFSMTRVDNDALTLMRSFSRHLQYVHNFPSQPEPPPVAWQPPGAADVSSGGSARTALPQSSVVQELTQAEEQSYAQAEDFVETPRKTEQTASQMAPERADQHVVSGDFVRVVSPGEGEAAYGARVDKDGVLNLVGDDEPQQRRQPRKTVSVRMSADQSKEEVVVKISDSQNTMSQSSSFSIGGEGRVGSSENSGSSSRESGKSSSLPGEIRDEVAGDRRAASQEFRSHISGDHLPEGPHRHAASGQEVGREGMGPPSGSLPEGPHKEGVVGGQGVGGAADGPHRDSTAAGSHEHTLEREQPSRQSVSSHETQAQGDAQRTRSEGRGQGQPTGSDDRGRQYPDEL